MRTPSQTPIPLYSPKSGLDLQRSRRPCEVASALAAGSARVTRQPVQHSRRPFSAGALKTTREGACAPLAEFHRPPRVVPFLTARPQCREELGANGIHLRLLDPVFQFQVRQKVPHGLHQTKNGMLRNGNTQPAGGITEENVPLRSPTPEKRLMKALLKWLYADVLCSITTDPIEDPIDPSRRSVTIMRSEAPRGRSADWWRRFSGVSWRLRSGCWCVAPICAGCGRSRR